MLDQHKIPNEVCLEETNCANCGSYNEEPFLQSTDRITYLPGLFSIVKCPNCSLQYLSPRPDSESIGYYYPESYPHYNKSSISSTTKKDGLLDRLKPAFKKIPSIKTGHLLEVGAASGEYLIKMKEMGWQVQGIEFSDYAASNARDLGLEVQTGKIEDCSFPKNYFDLIVGWMVVEHLHDPNSFFKDVKSYIKEDGYMVFSIPDCDSISRKMFGQYCYDIQLPTHLYHYNSDTITMILKKNGWNVEKIIWQNNAMTFLYSLKIWAFEKNHKWLYKLTNLIISSSLFIPIKYLLHYSLGLTKQSGRMIVWAMKSK